MNEPVRISVVSYLNSAPFIYGLKKWSSSPPINLQLDIPSICAEKLISGQADIGLVPVAILNQLSSYHILSDFCIGSTGPVTSVLLFSEVPLEEIDTIMLDYQSRTSVLLTKVLARNFWKINPQWENTSTLYEKEIRGTKAGVVIGDRALALRNRFTYQYDLSEEWKKMTGLPFVFAVWASSKKLDANFILEFNKSLQEGFKNIDKVIIEAEKEFHLDRSLVETYLKESISYNLDDKKKEALNLFLTLISQSK